MKKLTTLIACALLVAGQSYAQYSSITNICAAGKNPKGLNNDIEQPGTTGWTAIHTGSAASPAWSTTATIPFNFNFNGNNYTQFKVSTSGVLTFTTAAPTPPAYTSATIPNATIPDNSILAWGVRGTGANDQIRTKVFGTTPNRQQWIQFNSYSVANVTTGWCYWAIVLEETSNRIYVVDQRTYLNGGVSNLTVGVQINSTTATSITGSPNVQSQAQTQALDTPADNIWYEFMTGQSTYDMASTGALPMPSYLSLTQAPFTVKANIFNRGTATITSMDVNYTINGGSTITANLTGLNIAPSTCYQFSHPTTWNPTAGQYTVEAWASNLNGNNDGNTADDKGSLSIYVAPSLAVRTSLFEEPTSSTCGPCATYSPAVNALLVTNNVNSTSAKINSIKYQMNYPSPGNDPCYTAEATTRHSYYAVPGIPWCAVDGNQYQGHVVNFTQAMINTAQARPALFDMSGITANYSGTTVTIGGTMTSLVPLPSGSVLHLVIVENHINQADNGHGIQSNNETDWYQVMRKMIPSASGTSLGATTTGQVIPVSGSYNFTGSPVIFTSLSASSLVAFVQDNATEEVYQSQWKPLTLTGINDNESPLNLFSVYPNPTSNTANIMFELKQAENVKVNVTNMLGETVYTADAGNMSAGKHSIVIDAAKFSAGMYFVSFTVGNKVITEKLSVEK